MIDIIIVGAGPAGLTAAVYARRAGRSVLILERESFGGQIVYSPKVENFPGYLALSGGEIGEKLVDQALHHGAELELDEVTAIHDNGKIKSVALPNGKTVSYTYSGDDLVGYTNELGYTVTYNYDTNHLMTSWADAEGNVIVTNVYDAEGRVTGVNFNSHIKLITYTFPLFTRYYRNIRGFCTFKSVVWL